MTPEQRLADLIRRASATLLAAERAWQHRRRSALAWADESGDAVSGATLNDIIRTRAELRELELQMGQTVSDTHVSFHGEGSTGHPVAVRLHWGTEGIDETHAATIPQAMMWATYADAGAWSSMRSSFESWLDGSAASAPAKAKKAQFAAALRSAFGG